MTFNATEASTQDATPRELYRFAQGSKTWAYTSADRAITFTGIVHTKETISRTGPDYSEEQNAGGIDIYLPATNPVVSPYVGFQPALPLYVTVIRLHESGGAAVVFAGRVTQVTFEGPQATLACVPDPGQLSRQIPGLTYQSACNWALYGPGCGVDPEAFKTVATVSLVDGLELHAAAFGAQDDGWFTGGWVQLINGPRAGDRRFVLEHVGDMVRLQAPFVGLTAGDMVHAFAGCDRTEATCAAKFDNLVNHLGFSRIPILNPYQGRMY